MHNPQQLYQKSLNHYQIYISKMYSFYQVKMEQKRFSLGDDVSLQFVVFFYIFYNQMKQLISGEVLLTPSHQHEQSRKEKIEKKRKIRKEKMQKSHIDFTDLRSIDTSKLSRQQKAMVQKAKNRQAAQRSRDMHKEYVNNLQKEVKDLKEMLGKSRKFCWRCQKEMEESTIIDSYSNDHIIQSKQLQEQRNFSNFGQEQELIHQQSHRNNSIFGQDEYFLRVQSQEESYPYMKSLFFVAMVLVAVICVSSLTKEHLQSRALMEIPQLEAKEEVSNNKALQIKLNDIRNMTEDKHKTAIVKVETQQYGLIAFNNDDCIKSLINSTQPTQYVKKSLTSYADPINSKNSLAYSEGALICSMPKTKSFIGQPNEQRSPLVRLYLLGSQIKELISNFGLMVPIMDTNIQLNGIYQVLAKIKEVNMVTNHNCLL